ncbi:MAG: pyridoxal phosphate-dependent aminotransferase [Candidatus Bathyarchaeia archaeon]
MPKVSERIASIPLSGIRQIMEYAKGIRDIIYLNIGEPDLATPQHIKDAGKRAIDEDFTHYTPLGGFPELRQAIADKLKIEHNIEVDPESEVLITAGAQPGFFSSCGAILEAGDEVIVHEPFYPSYEVTLRVIGAKIVKVPLKEEEGYTLDIQKVEEKISEKTRAIILNSPNNPTGAVFRKDSLKAIAEIAKDHDLIVISDEVYEKLVYDGEKHISIASFDGMKERTIIVNSFSKTYAMTGWRIGFVVACRDVMKHISKVHHTMNVCASAISQRAAIAALRGSQKCVEEMVNEYAKRRDEIVRLVNEIKGFTCQKPKGAFFIFPNIKSYKMPSMEIAKYLIKEAGVVTVPGSSFGESGEGHIRISYAASIENIRRGMTRIKEAVEKLI